LYIYTYCTVQWRDSFAVFSITQDKRDEKGGEIERQKEREDGVTSSSVIGIQK
jgi:hypothetical protein